MQFAGLQYGGECWAGKGRVGKYGKRPDRECRMKCKRNPDKGRFCGNSWRNSMFDVRRVRVSMNGSGVFRYKAFMREVYMGCYVDKGKRDLERYFGRIN